MKTIFRILLVCVLIIESTNTFSQIAPESNPHRGLYADLFYKRLPSGELDPSVSILAVDTNRDGVFEQEDALLEYCAKNHFTYLTLYDIGQIIGRNRVAWNENTRQWEDMEKHLCRFIKKAKEQYCIDQVGAAAGSKSSIDSVISFMDRFPVTAPYRFRPEQIHSPAFNNRLRIAEQVFPEGSREEVSSEMLKFFLRVTDLNSCGECGAVFDVLNSEVEFWGNCPADYPSYADMAQHMYDVKTLYNSLHPDQPVMTEAYVSNLYYCTSPYSMNDVVHLLDGCSFCAPCPSCTSPHPRLIDRVLYAYLTPNAAYYIHHALNLFNDTSTTDSTDYHPILYSESADLGGLADFLGAWFPQSYQNNIFLAEMSFYSSWRNHASTNIALTSESDVQPGGAQWFSRQYMVDPLKNPLTFYTNGPRCDASGPANITFVYNGPPEIGSLYTFWVSRDSDNVIVYPPGGMPYSGLTDSYLPVINSTPGRRSIEFSDTSLFAPCNLLPGEYTAHLNLQYEGGDACGYQCDQPLVISGKPVISVWGDTTFCEGHYTWLRSNAGSAYQWYKDSLPIPGATTSTYKAVSSGHYYCFVTGAGTACSGFTDSVFIYVKPNPMVHINRHCNAGNVTLIANARDTSGTPLEYGGGGVTYQWSTGATTDRITVNYAVQTYRLLVTDPYTGCWRFTDTKVPASPTMTYSVAIQPVDTPSGSCVPDGSLICQYTPATSQPVSFLWNTGETSYNLSHIYSGQYSVITSVYDNSCSYFASYTLGPLPGGGPSINELIVPVSCHGRSDGSITLNLSGGNSPFRFFWENIPLDSIHDPANKDQSNLYPGIYTVNVFDLNGCRYRKQFTVPVSHSRIDISINSVTPVSLCATNTDGGASVAASGGTGPYQYVWNDPLLQSGAVVTNLPSGTWRVTAIDANNCDAVKLVSIPSAPPLIFSDCDTSKTWLDCAGDSTGLLKFCIQGGTPPYSVSAPWIMPDSVHIQLSNLTAGIYSATVTDGNGCISTKNASVTEPLPLILTMSTQATSCIGCNNGSLHINPSGGIPPYNWTLDPPSGVISDSTAEQLMAGIYTVCLSDVNSCQICVSDTVFEDPTRIRGDAILNTLSVTVFPNPSKAGAKVLISGIPAGNKAELSVCDLTGRTIYEKQSISSGEYELHAEFSPGVYLISLQVQDGQEHVWTRWFVTGK